ncbi:DUF1697 domain-containing protein [Paenibacillus harenae]|uniref:DUF1697 domain-containing protein n=1 Tax=Paenibacillus harenae TaxID=306543 RepID=UPI002791E210|nr:DUF1697 domain-containing protein [Paenibacillus harenae]MDQ0058689.1 uncharacterized protein (DUF1697 family) [Paenibacillus harenae]
MTIYIALLRGINVGGNNKIKMADLRVALGDLGLNNVQTYIQSGNVLFESEEDEGVLREKIEQQIEKVFGLPIKTILRTVEDLKNIVANLPFSEGQIAGAEEAGEGASLYVAMLLSEPERERIDKLRAFETEDERFHIVGKDVYLLFKRSVRNSKLSAQVEKLGVLPTTRNWNTINKLIELADAMAQ